MRARPRWMWLLLLGLAVVGAALFWTLSGHGARAALSYLGGMALVVAAFEFGRFNIGMADRVAPSLTLAVAMLSYLTTAIALGIVLAASSPRVVDAYGIASGLVAGLIGWLSGLVRASWARADHACEPVNITLHDESSTES